MSLWERINAAFFQSVTPRTAGFNTVDLTGLSQPAQLLIILLMLVGGSPGFHSRRLQNHYAGGDAAGDPGSFPP